MEENRDRINPPRPKEDILEAINIIEDELVTCTLMSQPKLFLSFPTIREGLLELLTLRKLISEKK